MNTQDIKKGSCIMLFLEGRSIGWATNHTFNLTGNSTDISNKDFGNYAASKPSNITWEMTSENLYSHEEYMALVDYMKNKTLITVKFGEAEDYSPDGLDDSDTTWTAPLDNYVTGKAYITSLSQNAPNGETATFSVTLTGVGKMTRVGSHKLTLMSQNITYTLPQGVSAASVPAGTTVTINPTKDCFGEPYYNLNVTGATWNSSTKKWSFTMPNDNVKANITAVWHCIHGNPEFSGSFTVDSAESVTYTQPTNYPSDNVVYMAPVGAKLKATPEDAAYYYPLYYLTSDKNIFISWDETYTIWRFTMIDSDLAIYASAQET